MAYVTVNSSSERHATLMELVKATRAQVEQHPEEHSDAQHPDEQTSVYGHVVTPK